MGALQVVVDEVHKTVAVDIYATCGANDCCQLAHLQEDVFTWTACSHLLTCGVAHVGFDRSKVNDEHKAVFVK